MLDIKVIEADTEAATKALEARGVSDVGAEISRIMKLRHNYLNYLHAIERSRNDMSRASTRYAELKKKAEETGDPRDKAAALSHYKRCASFRDRIVRLQERVDTYSKYENGLLYLPNFAADDVPDGLDESSNVEVHRWGVIPQIQNPLAHEVLGTRMGLMDFEQTAKVSGARFVTLKGPLAMMERALGQLMLNCTTATGHVEHSVPLLVNDEAMAGTGQLPKFKGDFYSAGKLNLIPTSEVSLTNMVRDQILKADELPLRMTALTPCFRSEAGSAGRDTRGMIRQHQFYKVEMVCVTMPEDSEAEHQRMVRIAENILESLGLPYRRVLLCKGDMGFSAQKTYDLEVWLPSQNTYREISSISNCGDFQARRMKTRVKNPAGKGTIFPHTLNGSALAVGRTLLAVMENYQQADGSIKIPSNLQRYMGDYTRILSNGKLGH